jgi:hypothetical protein
MCQLFLRIAANKKVFYAKSKQKNKPLKED